MRALLQKLRLLSRETKAATAVEYGLIVALVVLAVMSAIMAVSRVTIDMWNNVSTEVQNVT